MIVCSKSGAVNDLAPAYESPLPAERASQRIKDHEERFARFCRRNGRRKTGTRQDMLTRDIRYWEIWLCGWDHEDFPTWTWFKKLDRSTRIGLVKASSGIGMSRH